MGPAKKTSKKATRKATTTGAKKVAKKATVKKKAVQKSAYGKTEVESFNDDHADDEALDVDEMLSVENLLAKGRELEEEREARAEHERGVWRALRKPDEVRPANPVHWGYPFCLDGGIEAGEREALLAWFGRFRKVSKERGSGYFVVGPETEPEARRAAWDASGEVIEVEALRLQLPPDEFDARMERLARVLARPSDRGWSELAMLLLTWDEATLAAAVTEAERGLEAWPDEMRAPFEFWDTRPELRRLVRVHGGELVGKEDVAHVTVVRTQDMDGLEAGQHRFAHVKSLEVSGHSGLPERVAACTGFHRLERLVLHQPTYSEGTGRFDLGELLRAPHLQGLSGLSLYGYELTAGDLKALADCSQPLEHLKIQYAKMPPRAARELARLAGRRQLKSLDLKYNDLGPEGAEILFADAGSWEGLRSLDISANEIGDDGVRALAGAGLPELRWLSVSSNDPKNQLTADGAAALAEAKGLGRLETLHLFGHPLGAEGAAALIHSRSLRSLRVLNVGYTGVNLHELVKRCGDDPVRLTELNMGSPEAGKKALDLRKAEFLRSVRVLNLDSLDGALYAAVLGCPLLESLEELVLGGGYSNPAKAIAALTTVTPPPRLRYVGLSGWKLTASQAAALAGSPLGRQLWGVGLMASYTTPDAWYELYRGGLQTAGSATFDGNGPHEHHAMTTFREEV